MTPRVGTVPYLNALPLIEGLERPLVVEPPSRLTESLRAGRVDVALVSTIEYFRGEDLRLVPGMGVVSHGAVGSILVFSKVPIEKIDHLALDRSSRSAATMAKLVLPKAGAPVRKTSDCSPDARLQDLEADAMLLIGDPALRHEEVVPYRFDLGELWQEQTGLPFVYAMWIARGDADLGDLPERLKEARDQGVSKRLEIARAAALELGLAENVCARYLTEQIHYDVGPREIQGLRRFAAQAAEIGLCPAGVPIRFVEDPVGSP
ncbi:MAG: menaquinone biosynthesis protein [Planctomycetota bacterium]